MFKNLPKNWKTKKIKQICDVRGGKRLPQNHVLVNNTTEHPYIRVADFKDFNVDIKNIMYIEESTYSLIKNYIINKEDLYISIAGTIGLVGEIPKELDKANLTENAAKLVINNENIDKNYLKYCLNSFQIQQIIKELTVGVGVPKLSLSRINEIEIPVPDSIEEQKEIVKVIDTALDMIRIRQECIDHTNNLTPAIFQEMFSQIDKPNYTINNLVTQNILEKPLDGNHGDIHPKGSDFVKDGIPFIMASNLINGMVDVNNCSFIKKEQADKLRKGFSKTNDILLSHKGTIGKTAIVQPINTEYIMLTPQVTYYRIIDPTKINKYYLKSYFDSHYFQSIIKSKASKGATRAYIGILEQLNLPVYLPPIDLQNTFAEKAQKLEEYKQQQLGELEKAKQMFNSLLHHAFTGELTRKAYGD